MYTETVEQINEICAYSFLNAIKYPYTEEPNFANEAYLARLINEYKEV